MAWQTLNTWTISTNFQLRIDYEETATSAVYNTSTVRARVLLINNYSSSAIKSGTCGVRLSIGLNQTTVTTGINIPAGGVVEYASLSGIVVQHLADGTKSISISAQYSFALSSTVSGTVSGTATLTPLARNSTIAAMSSTVEINGAYACSVILAVKDESYRHKVEYVMGDSWDEGTYYHLSTDVVDQDSFVVPAEWAEAPAFADSTTAPGMLRVTTFSGQTQIGAAVTGNFTFKLPEVKPTIDDTTVTLSPVHSLTGFTKYVQGYSAVRATFSSEDEDYGTGAEITARQIVVSGQTIPATNYVATSGIVNANGAVIVQASAQDARGAVGYGQFTVTYQPYTVPSLINVLVFRCDSAGIGDSTGGYISVRASVIYSPVDGENSITSLRARVRVAGGTWAENWNNISAGQPYVIGDGSYLSTLAYEVQIQVVDRVGNSANAYEIVKSASKTINAKDGGLGVAFGKYAQQDLLLDSAWSIHTDEDLDVDGDGAIDGDLTVGGEISGHIGSAADKLVMTGAGGALTTADPGDIIDVDELKEEILNAVYPIGAIYMSLSSTDPGTLFGGTWTKIKDRFLLADGDTYSHGAVGGYTSVEHKHVAPVFASAVAGGQTFQGALNVNGNYSSSQGYMAYGSTQSVSTTMQVQHTEFYTGKQVNNPSTITDDNMPPYLVVYMWQRTA